MKKLMESEEFEESIRHVHSCVFISKAAKKLESEKLSTEEQIEIVFGVKKQLQILGAYLIDSMKF